VHTAKQQKTAVCAAVFKGGTSFAVQKLYAVGVSILLFNRLAQPLSDEGPA
jgi:hypothetical protein